MTKMSKILFQVLSLLYILYTSLLYIFIQTHKILVSNNFTDNLNHSTESIIFPQTLPKNIEIFFMRLEKL